MVIAKHNIYLTDADYCHAIDKTINAIPLIKQYIDNTD